MKKNGKILAAISGMLLATVLATNPTQAFKDNQTKKPASLKSTISEETILHYRGVCKGSHSICMSDTARFWYGDWYEY